MDLTRGGLRSEGFRRVLAAGTVLLGAVMLLWPAIYNGYPLLYPDSLAYLEDGVRVARAVFLHQFSPFYGVRSLVYSLSIFPLHGKVTPWPIALAQSLAVAWVLWRMVRCFALRSASLLYLLVVPGMSLLTSVSWYSVFIMPDVLGPVAYLCLFLLVYAENDSRGVRATLVLLAVWGITAHATHLLLAAGLCLLLTLFALLEGPKRSSRLHRLVPAYAALLLAVLVQTGLNFYLYQRLTLNGERPPYLIARLIGDGPGEEYLKAHCATEHWTLCAHLETLGDNPDSFLWSSGGAYNDSSEADQKKIRAEEMPLVKAILRSYPRQESRQALLNFRQQLSAFGLYGFDDNPWMEEQFKTILQPTHAAFEASRQARVTLPMDELSAMQWWVIVASWSMIGALTLLVRFRLGVQRAVLGGSVAALVVANAALTGVLSIVDDRYGCRVIWLVPLTAALFLVRQGTKKQGREARDRGTIAFSELV